MKGSKPNILEAIGHTPIVQLQRVSRGLKARIHCKLEYLNPGGSMKDRIAVNIIDDAEQTGAIKTGGTIVEATSGNTGMGLAQVAAVRGYQCIFVMPDKMSDEKIKALRAFGAKVVVCPTAVEPEDPRSYYSVARRLSDETPNAILANQYFNPANPAAHYKSTAPEIWEQTGGEFHTFVAGMGTGGTLSGCGKYFKEQNPELNIVGVDPVGSIYYDYWKTGQLTEAHVYKVEGIGEDFIPETMDLKILDEIVRVTDRECFDMTRRLVRDEGIYCGGSAGAAVMGAVKYAEQSDRDEDILVLLPDSAVRYLSKIFDDGWMRENGFLDDQLPLGTVAELMRNRAPVITTRDSARIGEVAAIMKERGVSQLPVIGEAGNLMGLVSESDLLDSLVRGSHGPTQTIEALVHPHFATVELHTQVSTLAPLLAQGQTVIVMNGREVVGIVTKIDLIDHMAKRLGAANSG